MMWNSPQAGSVAGSGRETAIDDPVSGRIMVIDDDPHFLRVMQRLLSGEQFEVVASSNPCEAVALLTSGSFDLIICDLRMPECDGLSLLQTIRNQGNATPVVILTAYGEVDTYLEAMNAGATEFLNKPMQSDDLLRVVRNCLRRNNHRRNAKRPDPV